MTMRGMNEMWRRTTLTLVFCFLLLHTCQGQNLTTVAGTTIQTSLSTETGKTSEVPPGPTTINPTNSTNADVTQAAGNVMSAGNSVNTETVPSLSESTNLPPELTQEVTDALNDSETETGTSEPAQIDYTNSTQEEVDTVFTRNNEALQSQQNHVFMPILVSGLIVAAALIGVYIWKNHCHTKTKGMKLAEDSYMADEENQGNTLVSVAPLNPPESQEKPNQNGESLEAVKTQNPPTATNGHSTAKADTEL